MENKYHLCLFSGGRGASSIISELVNVEEISLTILLNAYDDGLSTGYLRKLVPGMLGPSDIRKTFSTVLKSSINFGNPLLAELLEYRIGGKDSKGNVWDALGTGADMSNYWNGTLFLELYYENLPTRISRGLIEWSRIGFEYLIKTLGKDQIQKSLSDMAFGNVLFTGAFLQNCNDFNRTIDAWSKLFNVGVSILNITLGENRVLVGLKESGEFLKNEAAIVSKHTNPGRIKRIYLLDDYIEESESSLFNDRSFSAIENLLLGFESLPHINPEAERALAMAQMIVYGPGTQHSSLLPSYMTCGVAQTIAENTKAEKVFISNIGFDNDILDETHESLMENLTYYMNVGCRDSESYRKVDFITRSILSSSGDLNLNMSSYDNSQDVNNETSFAKWGSDNYSHDGKRVSRALLTIASMNTKLFQQQTLKSVSIIIPVLNEIQTLSQVISEVITFDWLGEGFVPQVIVVDGGSTDGSWEYLKQVNGILLLKNAYSTGRGSTIRTGLEIAKGDIVVTFPADNEYSTKAILDVAKALNELDFGIVFGSRSTLCVDTDSRLVEIYGGRTREYFLSKWGGFLLSTISAFRFRRWISDPLTSIKGFKSLEKMELSLKGHSLNWDTGIIVDSWINGIPIIEIPVQYSPRTRDQGKKTSVKSGITALWQVLRPTNAR